MQIAVLLLFHRTISFCLFGSIFYSVPFFVRIFASDNSIVQFKFNIHVVFFTGYNYEKSCRFFFTIFIFCCRPFVHLAFTYLVSRVQFPKRKSLGFLPKVNALCHSFGSSTIYIYDNYGNSSLAPCKIDKRQNVNANQM